LLVILLRKELLDTINSVKFLAVFAAYIILIPLALYIGQLKYENSLSSYQQAKTALERSLSTTVGAQDAELPALYRPSPLSILSRNMSPYFPASFEISAKNGVRISSVSVPPSLFEKVFGSFDLLFVVSVVVSLLSVLLVYDSISGEKEKGTLRLLLSYPIPRSQLLVAKFLGSWLASSLCIAIGMAIAFLVLLTLTNIVMTTELLVASLCVLGLSWAYCGTSLLLGLAASTFTYRSNNSLLVAVFVWLLAVMVIPRAGILTAAVLVDVDTPEQMNLKQTVLRQQVDAQKSRELAKVFNSANYDELRAPIVDKYNKQLSRSIQDLEDSHFRRREEQESLALTLAGVSPTTQLTRAMTELTDAGYGALGQLRRDVRLYNATVEKDVYSKGFRDEVPGRGVKMVFKPIRLSSAPQFVQTTPTMSERFAKIVSPVMMLLSLGFLILVVTYYRGLGYDPR